LDKIAFTNGIKWISTYINIFFIKKFHMIPNCFIIFKKIKLDFFIDNKNIKA
jgi:hypothetical protein